MLWCVPMYEVCLKLLEHFFVCNTNYVNVAYKIIERITIKIMF